jgi:threonine dehydrogenase-like Zn-dependent dehydrogenase
MGHGQGWGQRDFYPGAYGAYALAWGASCFEIGETDSFPEVAMMDILAVCLHVAETGGIQLGRPVLCIGAGPAGNGVAQMSLTMGASAAILVDRSLTALEIGSQQGLGHRILIETDLEAAAAQVRALAPGGFGTVFDTVGSAQSLAFAIEHLGKAGTLVNLAVHDASIPINFLKLGSERRIVTSCNFEVGDYPRALAMLQSGRVSVRDWLTPVTLDELPEWFARIHANPLEKGAFKLVMVPET